MNSVNRRAVNVIAGCSSRCWASRAQLMSLLLFSLVRGLSSGIRVNKCLAAQVSRREADRLCQAGRVLINGKRKPGEV